MELLYYHAPHGNFGDDLNKFIWKTILPQNAFEVDNVILMGVGSIFNSGHAPIERTRGKRVFVLGSGAGIFSLPEGWKNWSILAVRGPLTARLIGRPELAATDAAAFMAMMPLPKVKRTLTLFMPHYAWLELDRWDRICEAAGITFVDPRWNTSRIIELFSRARLVLAGAMHAAIVADALRIPWIPIITTLHEMPFKWLDWTLSLNLPYRPVSIPAPSFENRLRGYMPPRRGQKFRIDRVQADSEYLETSLIADFKAFYGDKPMSESEAARIGTSWWKYIAKKSLRNAGVLVNPFLTEKTVHDLRHVSEGPSYMSSNSIFAEKLDRLHVAKQAFLDAIR